jgi:class 3 adenylate cyclase
MGDDPSTSDSGGSVRTFLIADVRGYTNYTQTFGDVAAADLTRRFAEVAATTVTAYGGELVETRGDEILAVFNSTRSALRASVELQRALRSADDGREPLALGVGVGLDSGEAVPHEGGYRGAALNLAARLCGIAAPGEILASQGVAHLAGRIDGLKVAPRRPVRLKGLDEPVRAVTITPEQPLPPLPALKSSGGTLRTTRNKRFAAIAVVTAMILATIVVTSLRGPQGLAAIAPDAAGVIDVASGEIIGEVPIEGRPGGLAIGLGAVWLAGSCVGRKRLE